MESNGNRNSLFNKNTLIVGVVSIVGLILFLIVNPFFMERCRKQNSG